MTSSLASSLVMGKNLRTRKITKTITEINENDNRLAPPGEYDYISLRDWMTDLVCNPNPSSNINYVMNGIIFSDGQKLTKTKNDN